MQMPRGKPYSPRRVNAVLQAQQSGMRNNPISLASGVPPTSIRGIKFRHGRVGGLPRRPRIYRRKICDRLGLYIKTMILDDYRLCIIQLPGILKDRQRTGDLDEGYDIPSASTIRKWLKKQGFVRRLLPRKPILSARHRENRVAFARRWLNNEIGEPVFSDESCFFLNPARDVHGCFQGNVPREQLPNNARVQAQGGKRMVWGVISRDGPGPLEILPGGQSMNGAYYRPMLNRLLPNYWQELHDNNANDLDVWFEFMQDGAPCHRARDTVQLVKDITGLDPIEWPAFSPDLNPIENVWGWMKRQMLQMPPARTVDVLEERIRNLWSQVTPAYCQSLYDSLDRRAEEVIRKNGGSINY